MARTKKSAKTASRSSVRTIVGGYNGAFLTHVLIRARSITVYLPEDAYRALVDREIDVTVKPLVTPPRPADF